jgi:hypothetical protein
MVRTGLIIAIKMKGVGLHQPCLSQQIVLHLNCHLHEGFRHFPADAFPGSEVPRKACMSAAKVL